MFTPIWTEHTPLDELPPQLKELHAYWCAQRKGHAWPMRAEMDPARMRSLLGSIAILQVEGRGCYRWRLYGTKLPRRWGGDMTGRTTMELSDVQLARAETHQIDEVLDAREPVCFRVEALWDGLPQEHLRLILPLSRDSGGPIDRIMTVLWRVVVPYETMRRIGGFRPIEARPLGAQLDSFFSQDDVILGHQELESCQDMAIGVGRSR